MEVPGGIMIIVEADGLFLFRTTERIICALEDHGIFLSYRKGDRSFGDQGADILASITPSAEAFTALYEAGRTIPHIGFASYTNSNLPARTRIGRYCSIARNVEIMEGGHPTNYITTHPISYQLWAAVTMEPPKHIGGKPWQPLPHVDKDLPTIENDVWIGQNVLVGRGVSIGNGSVIAAGSVVTRDIEPYSIVGGNPARHIRYRVPEAIIPELLRIRWWRFAYPHLSDLDYAQPEVFIRQVEAKEASGELVEYRPDLVDVYNIVKSEC